MSQNNKFKVIADKYKSKNAMTADEFIGAASDSVNVIDNDPALQQSKTKTVKSHEAQQKNVLLTVAGKMNRERDCSKPSLIYFKNDIKADMEKYCNGNKNLVINYLLRKGLDALIEEGEMVVHIEES